MYRYLVVFFLPLLLVTCRKPIDHPLGLIEQDPTAAPEPRWVEVEDSPNDVRALEIFDGDLWLGGDFIGNGYKFLLRYNGDFYQTWSGDFVVGQGIYDLHATADRIYVGGRYTYTQFFQGFSNFMFFTSSSFPYGDEFGGSTVSVHSFQEVNSSVYMCGRFNTDEEGILFNNIAEIPPGAISFAGVESTARLYDYEEYNGEKYAAGGESSFQQLDVKGCGRWTGSGWEECGAHPLNNWAVGFALEKFQGKLFLAAHAPSSWNSYITVYDGSSWENFPEIEATNGQRSYLKTIGNSLYFMANGVSLNGMEESNILVYDGATWSAMGDMDAHVHDIIEYEEELYIATDEGLFRWD